MHSTFATLRIPYACLITIYSCSESNACLKEVLIELYFHEEISNSFLFTLVFT